MPKRVSACYADKLQPCRSGSVPLSVKSGRFVTSGRFAAPKRQALVAAFLVETRKALLDQVVTMHDQYMTGLERRSRLAFEDKHRRLRRRARTGIDTLLATVDALLDADREAPISSLQKDIDEESLRGAAADCRAFARLEERGFVDELAARYGDLRKYLPAFLRLP